MSIATIAAVEVAVAVVTGKPSLSPTTDSSNEAWSMNAPPLIRVDLPGYLAIHAPPTDALMKEKAAESVQSCIGNVKGEGKSEQ